MNLKQNVLFLDDNVEVMFENEDLDFIVEYQLAVFPYLNNVILILIFIKSNK